MGQCKDCVVKSPSTHSSKYSRIVSSFSHLPKYMEIHWNCCVIFSVFWFIYIRAKWLITTENTINKPSQFQNWICWRLSEMLFWGSGRVWAREEATWSIYNIAWGFKGKPIRHKSKERPHGWGNSRSERLKVVHKCWPDVADLRGSFGWRKWCERLCVTSMEQGLMSQ